ncbi:DEAD/DEAH box helicase family protein [Legionella sp. W05-934-2]|jgi:hypothetical protein|uniref:DEAD/DEAH box helicase family protein n=1 Tax=Legionella sp. W05-934-2 TaxID=1198649 RepID=UPI0034629F06
MPNSKLAQEVGKQIQEYGDAVLGRILLSNVIDGKSITDVHFKELVDSAQKANKKLTAADIINEMISNPDKFGLAIDSGKAIKLSTDNSRVYEIQIERTGESTYDLKVIGKYTDDKMVATPARVMHAKINPDSSIDIKAGDAVFTSKAPAPRELQADVIEKFGQAVANGEPSHLAIMGTGSGKSWVLAGVTHAVGHGIFVVPNDSLAKETRKDAIMVLHGQSTKVYMAKDLSVDEFKKAIQEEHVQIIMTADDPLFFEKSKLVKNRTVCIDESHQHTFNEAQVHNLETMKQNNVMLAVTGTPTSKLNELFGNKALVDVNIRTVMDAGQLRPIIPQHQTNIASDNIERTLIEGYFGRQSYLSSGEDYVKPDPNNANVKSKPLSEQVDYFVEKNRVKSIDQKNFFFNGDPTFREKMMGIYNQIAKGTYSDLTALQKNIQIMRRDAEVDYRMQVMKELGDKRPDHEIKDDAIKQVGEGKPVDLKQEIEASQKAQVAQFINSNAAALAFGKKPFDMELLIRKGKFNQLMTDNKPNEKDSSKANTHPEDWRKNKAKQLADKYFESEAGQQDIQKLGSDETAIHQLRQEKVASFLKKLPTDKKGIGEMIQEDLRRNMDFVGGLPPDQREKIIEKVAKTTVNFMFAADDKEAIKAMSSGDNIDLEKLGATYAANSTNDMSDSEKNALLDGLRTGLVMHVGSGTAFSTGISIPSVLSTQQAILNDKDELNNALDTPQLHGRTVRNKDSSALNQQVVAKGVVNHLPLPDIIAKDSNAKTMEFFKKQIFYNAQTHVGQQRLDFGLKVREKFEGGAIGKFNYLKQEQEIRHKFLEEFKKLQATPKQGQKGYDPVEYNKAQKQITKYGTLAVKAEKELQQINNAMLLNRIFLSNEVHAELFQLRQEERDMKKTDPNYKDEMTRISARKSELDTYLDVIGNQGTSKSQETGHVFSAYGVKPDMHDESQSKTIRKVEEQMSKFKGKVSDIKQPDPESGPKFDKH